MAKRKRKNQKKVVNQNEAKNTKSKTVNQTVKQADDKKIKNNGSKASETSETKDVKLVNSTQQESKKVKEKTGPVGNFKFLSETQTELSKVVWPSRQQLISESAAVILMVTLVATTIYFVDNFFTWVAGKVF